jgi:hypothetical protein
MCPIVSVKLDTPYLTGIATAVVLSDMAIDLIIGNVRGVSSEIINARPRTPPVGWKNHVKSDLLVESDEENFGVEDEVFFDTPCIVDQDNTEVIEESNITSSSDLILNAVTTRANTAVGKVKLVPLERINLKELDLTLVQFRELQKSDVTLVKLFEKVGAQSKDVFERYVHQYFLKNDLLYRKVLTAKGLIQCELTQLVVPKSLRDKVLSIAHESLLGAHMGAKKTEDKIEQAFYWPGIQADVKRYCYSCDICQRTTNKGSVRKVPLQLSELAHYPFQHVYVDLVGEMVPPSREGHRWILTLCYVVGVPGSLALCCLGEPLAKAKGRPGHRSYTNGLVLFALFMETIKTCFRRSSFRHHDIHYADK